MPYKAHAVTRQLPLPPVGFVWVEVFLYWISIGAHYSCSILLTAFIKTAIPFSSRGLGYLSLLERQPVLVPFHRLQLNLLVCAPFGAYELGMDIESFSYEGSTREQRTSWLIKNGLDQVFTGKQYWIRIEQLSWHHRPRADVLRKHLDSKPSLDLKPSRPNSCISAHGHVPAFRLACRC